MQGVPMLCHVLYLPVESMYSEGIGWGLSTEAPVRCGPRRVGRSGDLPDTTILADIRSEIEISTVGCDEGRRTDTRRHIHFFTKWTQSGSGPPTKAVMMELK